MTHDMEADEGLLRALHGLRADPRPAFRGRVLGRLGLPDHDGGDIDDFVLLDGPVGQLFVAFNQRGVCHIVAAADLGDDPRAFLRRHRERLGRPSRPAPGPPAGLLTALRTGRGRPVPVDLGRASEFERSVLLKARDIPRGEVRSYAWVAKEIGRPRAVRAVGSALGRNPVPVLIPCHRVVRSDGQVGEYVFGGPMKRELLMAESVDLDQAQRLARAGVQLVGSDTTNIFCLPTCHNARRITARHRVPFRRPEQARQAGYRPCRECRPAADLGA